MLDMDAVKRFKANALNPNNGHCIGSAEQPETFFQHREACNENYEEQIDVIIDCINRVNERVERKRPYKPYEYYGAPDAEEIIIAMGSVCDCAEETVDYLNAQGKKVGLISVRLYRPFSAKHFVSEIPSTVKKMAVLDRTKEPGAPGEPLYLDVVSAIRDTEFAGRLWQEADTD